MRCSGFFHRILARFGCHKTNGLERRISKKLDLDNDQQEKLSKLNITLKGVKESLHDIQRQGLLGLDELLISETLDQEKAGEILKQGIQVADQRRIEVVNSFAEFFDSLKQRQREALREMINRRNRCCCC